MGGSWKFGSRAEERFWGKRSRVGSHQRIVTMNMNGLLREKRERTRTGSGEHQDLGDEAEEEPPSGEQRASGEGGKSGVLGADVNSEAVRRGWTTSWSSRTRTKVHS